jgi:membrane protein YqaA with SNARE-associated domain
LKAFNKIRLWVLATLPAWGAGGIFLAGFLDSSILSLPLINDLLVIQLSILHPGRMPLYVAAATLGSLAGGLLVYALAHRGGEVYFHRHAGGRAARIRHWIERNTFLSVAIGAILPPPMPFKLLVIGAGVFQAGLRPFSLALVAGRGFRYLVIGLVAVRYGQAAERAIIEHKFDFALAACAFVLASYLATRLLFRSAHV